MYITNEMFAHLSLTCYLTALCLSSTIIDGFPDSPLQGRNNRRSPGSGSSPCFFPRPLLKPQLRKGSGWKSFSFFCKYTLTDILDKKYTLTDILDKNTLIILPTLMPRTQNYNAEENLLYATLSTQECDTLRVHI